MEENQLPSTLARPAKLIEHFLANAAKECQEYMKRDPENLNFVIVALAGAESFFFEVCNGFPQSMFFFHKYQAEDDLQGEIEELEIKLMRSNAVKEELDGIHLKVEKIVILYDLRTLWMLFFHYYHFLMLCGTLPLPVQSAHV